MKDISQTVLEKVLDAMLNGYDQFIHDQDGNLVSSSRVPSLLPQLVEMVANHMAKDEKLMARVAKKVNVDAVAKAITKSLITRGFDSLSYSERERIENALKEKEISVEEYDKVVQLVKKTK